MKRTTGLCRNRFSSHRICGSRLKWLLLLLVSCVSGERAWGSAKAGSAVTIAVSPSGDDSGAGTKERPFRTLRRAQQAVREVNVGHDVTVELGDGVYRLSEPLIFTASDGGRNGHHVSWTAAEGAKPVLSGASAVTGWKLFDKEKQIWVADVPAGVDARELWVDDALARPASIEVPRADVEFTRRGIVFKDAKYDSIAKLSDANRLEIEATGFFTDRFSPVEKAAGRTLVMKQPAWDNNIWGYDSMSNPYHPEFAHLYLRHSLEFLSQPGQWYLDSAKGKLYLRPRAGVDLNRVDVELPRLTVLVAVGNSLDEPVEELSFSHLRFSHTTWMGPGTVEGYASQQSGSFLTGQSPAYPENPLVDCKFGCPAFETMRNLWSQMPASVEVAAAAKITFEDDAFAHLGQYALGIGNDANANLTGAGLGTSDITVKRCVFTDIAGGAILAGGVRRNAHHPEDPRQINQQLIVWNNRIRSVSEEYRDESAILSTYVAGAVILHNDISDVPYDAIDIGYGWGMHDPGGNANYRVRMHGYESKENLVYDTPTTHHDVVVASNRVHGAKRFFHDGGAIYNLSASPGTLITENYIFGNSARIGIYLDEGSRYITVRRNVIEDKGSEWLNVNTVHSAYPLRISPDNTAVSNWHDGTKVGGLWTNYQNNLILDDHLVTDGGWPAEAQQVMKDAGIETSAGPVAYGDAKPGEGEAGKP
jgi:hypothetical protein